MSKRISNKSFFEIPAINLAQNLLGKILCRKLSDGKIIKKWICETEAYGGFEIPDSASHASRGKTKRNVPMFEDGGTIYIYLIYGLIIYWILSAEE